MKGAREERESFDCGFETNGRMDGWADADWEARGAGREGCGQIFLPSFTPY